MHASVDLLNWQGDGGAREILAANPGLSVSHRSIASVRARPLKAK